MPCLSDQSICDPGVSSGEKREDAIGQARREFIEALIQRVRVAAVNALDGLQSKPGADKLEISSEELTRRVLERGEGIIAATEYFLSREMQTLTGDVKTRSTIPPLPCCPHVDQPVSVPVGV